MKTFVKTFRNDNRVLLEREVNNYAEENNLEIISVSHSVRAFEPFMTDDIHYLAVVFRKVR